MHTNTKAREINEAIESGLYKVANLDMFDIVDKIQLEDRIIGSLEYTEEILMEHLQEIKELEGFYPGLQEYLKALRSADIIDNQHLEKENSFLVGMFMQVGKEAAIDKLIRYKKENKQITDGDIFSIHNTLLYGTSSDGAKSLRTTNETFVGKVVNGTRTFDYFPIDHKEVPEAIIKIAELYNERLKGDTYNNLFVQSFLIHGLVATLQAFEDGNTRMGRIMQHALIWQLINERTGFNFELPPIYATAAYNNYRNEYRGIISQLVKENTNEIWNTWFNFNLRRIQDQIWANNENIKIFKTKNSKIKTLHQ